MNKQMPEFIIPREEKEMCALFEDFLFMRIKKSSGYRKEKGDEKFKMVKKDLKLLHQTGVVNRIFRRWFQTTWGNRNWSKFFDGETPRQELAHYYSDFGNGNATLFVEMVNINKTWTIIPHLTLIKNIPKDDSIFTYGLKNIKLLKDPPGFDFGFKKFSEFLFSLEKNAKNLRSYNPPDNESEKWWKLFWSQVGTSLVHNIKLELSKEQLLKAAYGLQEYLDSILYDANDFIEIDYIFEDLWNILRNIDNRLEPYAEMINKNKENMWERIHEINYIYSTKVFYHLGHMFDEKILFPADMYFAGVECVWTDKQHILGTTLEAILLLKNNLDNSNIFSGLNVEEKKQLDYMGIMDTAMNINRMWFTPPTAFRFLPSVKDYF